MCPAAWFHVRRPLHKDGETASTKLKDPSDNSVNRLYINQHLPPSLKQHSTVRSSLLWAEVILVFISEGENVLLSWFTVQKNSLHYWSDSLSKISVLILSSGTFLSHSLCGVANFFVFFFFFAKWPQELNQTDKFPWPILANSLSLNKSIRADTPVQSLTSNCTEIRV